MTTARARLEQLRRDLAADFHVVGEDAEQDTLLVFVQPHDFGLTPFTLIICAAALEHPDDPCGVLH
jgi:hypothetical protein